MAARDCSVIFGGIEVSTKEFEQEVCRIGNVKHISMMGKNTIMITMSTPVEAELAADVLGGTKLIGQQMQWWKMMENSWFDKKKTQLSKGIFKAAVAGTTGHAGLQIEL